jgi:hypothetical protein
LLLTGVVLSPWLQRSSSRESPFWGWRSVKKLLRLGVGGQKPSVAHFLRLTETSAVSVGKLSIEKARSVLL